MPKAPQIHLSTKASPEVQKLPLTQIIEEYLLQYASGESHTSRAKKLDLKAFLQFLSRFKKTEPNDLCVGDWDHSACQYFVDTLLEHGESPATVGRRLATIKHMGRVFAERIPGFINPAREIKSPKMQILKPKYLEQEEVKRVVDFAASKKAAKPDFKRIRNEVIVRLLLDTGLRADEIRNLRLQQISEELDWIKQVRTKGRRFRNVYITSECRPHLKKYLEARREQLIKYFPRLSGQIDGKLPVFVSFYRAKPLEPDSFLLSPKSLWRVVKECSQGTKLHPHLLRHTYATDLLESSRDVRLVAQALGHSDVRITMRYTERADEELAKALEENRKRKSSK